MKTFFRVPQKVHNALRIVSHLAEKYDSGDFVSLNVIAERENVSQGYLEEIAAQLKSAGILVSKRGAKGGYSLVNHPADIRISDIVIAMEGPNSLPRTPDIQIAEALNARCASHTVWQTVQNQIAETLMDMTLADVTATRRPKATA